MFSYANLIFLSSDSLKNMSEAAAGFTNWRFVPFLGHAKEIDAF